MENVRAKLSFLGKELIEEIIKNSTVMDVPSNQELLREDQYVKVLPILLDGLLKVFSRHDEKELLLYYIQPLESCIMSFSSIINHEPSKIYAVTETDSTVLLIPSDKIPIWVKKYPKFNDLIFQQYNLRYMELLDSIQHMIFDKLDTRIFDYLLEKKEVIGENPIHITHRQIASELGSSREVISRLMKKMESDGKIELGMQSVKIIEL